ncbi:MAG: DUF934 domain-containing protein [Alphaproteobacteria bacterium]|nr:DUF934 domain-containing protein [Alphaproteobacteria bacterium]
MRPSSPVAPAPALPVLLLRADGAPADAAWIDVADDAPVPEDQAAVVSYARFLAEGATLRAARLGVRIAPADKVEALAPHLARLALIVVTFPKFRDGRGYTTARLLRERFGYQGDVRAEGDVLRDQLAFMIRCGFSSFAVKDRAPQEAVAAALRRFSVVYQPAADAAPPIWRRRASVVRAAAE